MDPSVSMRRRPPAADGLPCSFPGAVARPPQLRSFWGGNPCPSPPSPTGHPTSSSAHASGHVTSSSALGSPQRRASQGARARPATGAQPGVRAPPAGSAAGRPASCCAVCILKGCPSLGVNARQATAVAHGIKQLDDIVSGRVMWEKASVGREGWLQSPNMCKFCLSIDRLHKRLLSGQSLNRDRWWRVRAVI